MNDESVTRLEVELAHRFGRAAAVVVGSGTAALFCAFEWLRLHHAATEPKVLFPEITCETAVHAAVFADCIPCFCDVSPDDALIDAAAARRAVAEHSPLALVPTHIFGHLVDTGALRGQVAVPVAFVEDAAQGYGGELGGLRAGSMGDMSVISFGRGKLLDSGAGGALLCDDENQAQACRGIAAQLPNDGRGAAAEREQLMAKMLAARRTHRSDREALVRRQWQVLREHRAGYLSRCPPELASRILRLLPQMQEAAQERAALTAQLDDLLCHAPQVRLPRRAGRVALWRYSFFVDEPNARDTWADRLQAAGLEVSKLFSACSTKFAATPVAGPGAQRVAASVINLQFPPDPATRAQMVRAIEKAIP